jgi:hypothetical protein
MPFIAARVLHDSPKFFGKTFVSQSGRRDAMGEGCKATNRSVFGRRWPLTEMILPGFCQISYTPAARQNTPGRRTTRGAGGLPGCERRGRCRAASDSRLGEWSYRI